MSHLVPSSGVNRFSHGFSSNLASLSRFEFRFFRLVKKRKNTKDIFVSILEFRYIQRNRQFAPLSWLTWVENE